MLRHLQAESDFDWSQALKVMELSDLVMRLVAGKLNVESGSNIIVVNNRMVGDLVCNEKLFGFNSDTGELTKL